MINFCIFLPVSSTEFLHYKNFHLLQQYKKPFKTCNMQIYRNLVNSSLQSKRAYLTISLSQYLTLQRHQ